MAATLSNTAFGASLSSSHATRNSFTGNVVQFAAAPQKRTESFRFVPEAGKKVIGKVVSNKMQKTVVVAVERKVMHSKYLKRVTRVSKFSCHDESDAIEEGQIVEIEPIGRKVSKTKSWVVSKLCSKEGCYTDAVNPFKKVPAEQ